MTSDTDVTAEPMKPEGVETWTVRGNFICKPGATGNLLELNYEERQFALHAARQHEALVRERDGGLARVFEADAERDRAMGLYRIASDERAALRARVRELEDVLPGILRICDAARHTAGLGKNQLERIEKARALLKDKRTGEEA